MIERPSTAHGLPRRMLRSGLAALLLATACTGRFHDVASRDARPQGGTGGLPTGGAGGGGDDDGVERPSLPAIRSTDGLRALTRREYVETVQRLLGVRVDPAAVPLETLVAGHSKIARGQQIVRGEIEAFYGLGVSAADEAAAALPCKPVTDACARAFVAPFLRRAFREEPSEATRNHYLGMLEAADAGDNPSERLVTVIAAALSSPAFLYRFEVGAAEAGPVHRLGDYEIATRLAYLVWEAGPDDELLAAAAAGKLRDPAAREAQLRRLLADARGGTGLRGFVLDWMGLVDPESRIRAKNPEVLARTPADLEPRALASVEATIDHVLEGGQGRFAELLATDEYVADAAVAQLIGLATEGSDAVPRRLDPTRHRGMLLHPAVVAAHTGEGGASPFLIGKFIYENVLCGVLGNVPEVPAIDEDALGAKTLRQRLEEVTSPPGCQTCHAHIGPPGFAFLGYDVLGRYAPLDRNGNAHDTRGSVTVEGSVIAFANAPELAAGLAAHQATARCAARRLFRFAFGRFEAPEDEPLLGRIAGDQARGTTLDALVELVRSDEFTRARVEAP